MDYMWGLRSNNKGNDYIFVMVDRFSKMAILTAYKNNIIEDSTTKQLFKWVWVHFNIPQTIISYWDSRFLGTFWSNIWSLLDTQLTKSTAFHPQIDF